VSVVKRFIKKYFKKRSPPFRVPKNITQTNMPVRLMENAADYSVCTMASIKVNQKLSEYAIKNDQIWKKIPLPILGNTFFHESVTIKYFIEEMGVTTLSSDPDGNLIAEFGDLRATFYKIEKSKPWTAENAAIREKGKTDAFFIKLRSEAFNRVTVRDHLCYCHLTYSNYLYQAVYNLGKDSILYPLLYPHTLGALDKNSNAYWNLYNGRGILLAAAGEVDNHPYILAEFENGRRHFLKHCYTFPEWLEKKSGILDHEICR